MYFEIFGRLFSSHSITANSFLHFPVKLQFIMKAVVTPVIIFAPLLFMKQEIPSRLRACSINAQVVVFPLVPVTHIMRAPPDSFLSISGLILRASLPGRVVAPLPKSLRISAVSFAIISEIIILNLY